MACEALYEGVDTAQIQRSTPIITIVCVCLGVGHCKRIVFEVQGKKLVFTVKKKHVLSL